MNPIAARTITTITVASQRMSQPRTKAERQGSTAGPVNCIGSLAPLLGPDDSHLWQGFAERVRARQCHSDLVHNDRTSPSTAHALPAPVIGIRLFDPSPPVLTGREVIGQEPSAACVLIKKACARWMTGS